MTKTITLDGVEYELVEKKSEPTPLGPIVALEANLRAENQDEFYTKPMRVWDNDVAARYIVYTQPGYVFDNGWWEAFNAVPSLQVHSVMTKHNKDDEDAMMLEFNVIKAWITKPRVVR